MRHMIFLQVKSRYDVIYCKICHKMKTRKVTFPRDGRFNFISLDDVYTEITFSRASLWFWAAPLTANRFKNKLYVSRIVRSPFFPSRAIPTHPHFYSLFRRPFSGCYNKFYEKGTYTCIVCDQELFSSDTKYDSGCGWPAFNEVLDQGRIKLTKDTSHGKRLWSSLAYLL